MGWGTVIGTHPIKYIGYCSVQHRTNICDCSSHGNLAHSAHFQPQPVLSIGVAARVDAHQQKIRLQESLAGTDFSDFDPVLNAVRTVATMEIEIG
jgi:hypothetical protein